MKILLLGSGGREHALAWKILKSSHTKELFVAPGNAGIAEHAECVALDPTNVQSVVNQIITNYKPQKIVLFGSQAQGQATPDSDYDLFMIKDTSGSITKRQYDVWKSIDNWSIPFDFIVYTPQEVEQAKKNKSWFMGQIESKGKILYAN